MNLNVRVNPGPLRDEVFVTSQSNDPNYVNRTVYAKPGLFRSGEFSIDTIAALEVRSQKELKDDLDAKLNEEAKARESALPTVTEEE